MLVEENDILLWLLENEPGADTLQLPNTYTIHATKRYHDNLVLMPFCVLPGHEIVTREEALALLKKRLGFINEKHQDAVEKWLVPLSQQGGGVLGISPGTPIYVFSKENNEVWCHNNRYAVGFLLKVKGGLNARSY